MYACVCTRATLSTSSKYTGCCCCYIPARRNDTPGATIYTRVHARRSKGVVVSPPPPPPPPRGFTFIFSFTHPFCRILAPLRVRVCVCTIMKYRVSIRIEDKNAFRGHKTTGVDIEIFEEEKKWSVTFDKGPRKGNVVSGEISGPRLLHILFIIRIALFFFLFFLFYLLTS